MLNPQKLTKVQQAKLDQETVINWNGGANEATVISSSPKQWLKMEKLGIEPFRQTENCRWYEIPKDWIKVKKPGKPRGRSINENVEARVARIRAL